MTPGSRSESSPGPRSVTFLYPPDDRVASGGADIRVKRLFTALRVRWPSTFVTIGPGQALPSNPSARARLVAMLRGVPPRLTQRWEGSLRSRLAEATRDADLIVLGTTFCAPLVPPSVLSRCILDAHNLEWRVVSQLARSSPRPRRWAYRATEAWTRAYERRLARRVRGVWAVSQEEADWFAAAGAPRVWVIPNGVDLPPAPPPPPIEPALIFVGSLQGLFNRDGVEWFLETCWAAVRRAVPGVVLIVAGRGGDDLRAEGIETHGYVTDLSGLYARSSVAIVPLRLGAGTRLKIPEAMAYGRPVVSTPVGAEGHRLAEEDGVLIAGSSEEFAAVCIDLLRNAERAARIGAAGRLTAETRFQWSAIGRAAAATLDESS